MSTRNSALPALVAAAFWLGMLIGVSFLATPVKFAAPTLSLPVALDVGRVTFGLFSRIEWIAAAVLLLCVLPSGISPLIRAAASLAVMIVALQAAWLLPIMDARIASIIEGAPPPASYHHTLYIALEIVKTVALAAIAVMSLSASTAANHNSQNSSGAHHDRAAYPG